MSSAQGKVFLFSYIVVCSWVLVPGTMLINNWVLVVLYGTALAYLFLGISIVADLFMEAIE